METKYLADVPLSSLMLGTVQFGLPYGVANTHGQPSYETARDILACAFEGGVCCLDTAPRYGESEAVLGRALAELGIADQMTVISKTPALVEGLPLTDAEQLIEEKVVESLRLLKLERIPILLIHREENAEYLDAVVKLKKSGMVGHVGVTPVTPGLTSELIADERVEALQFPTSMLDQRFNYGGQLRAARAKDIPVFARSVYLQGLINMPEGDIPPDISAVIPVRRRLEATAKEAGISISEMAMRYVMALDGVTCTMVGVETVEQMRENLAIFARGPLEEDLCQVIETIVPDLPDKILSPALWNTRMPDVILAKAK